jgi:hypothetical protein
MGFEPTISCVTGRRALQAAPRGRIALSVAQVGVEPTASLVLSQGGLPVAYRADCVFSTQSRNRTCKHTGLSRAALPVGISGRIYSVVPAGIEFPGCEPSVVAVGRRDRKFVCMLNTTDCLWIIHDVPKANEGVFNDESANSTDFDQESSVD